MLEPRCATASPRSPGYWRTALKGGFLESAQYLKPFNFSALRRSLPDSP